MGRPLYPYYTKDITVHCYEEDNGSLVSSKLEKQVGYNKYKNSNDVVIILGDRDEVLANKVAGTGYVIVTDKELNTHSLRKLTDNLITCFDDSIFKFEVEKVIENGVAVSVKMKDGAEAFIEGIAKSGSSSGSGSSSSSGS